MSFSEPPKNSKLDLGSVYPSPSTSPPVGPEKFKVGFRVGVTLGDVPRWVDVGGWLTFDYDSRGFNLDG